ncbi:MAG: peptide deformylase [Chloroflexi bacterium RBG_16_51_9]|nr:MAG: peptide deformylase [Chloroflexi bacterium RBG_16_51_9]
MAVLPIRVAPDPVLRKKSKRVKSVDSSIRRLIKDMIETMHAAPGVGLAAPQVGIPLRVIVIGIPEEEEICLINPEVVRRKGERIVDEGCLSIPGYTGQLKRSETVTVKGRDPKGKEIRIKADELLAQALEHEIDHINGVLYIDRMENMDSFRKVVPKKPEEIESENEAEKVKEEAEL